LFVKTPWHWLRGVVQESADAPGHCATTIMAWSRGERDSGRWGVGVERPILSL
jgi:hypothetical protein